MRPRFDIQLSRRDSLKGGSGGRRSRAARGGGAHGTTSKATGSASTAGRLLANQNRRSSLRR